MSAEPLFLDDEPDAISLENLPEPAAPLTPASETSAWTAPDPFGWGE